MCLLTDRGKMAQETDEEPNPLPTTREGRIDFVEKRLIPLLDSPKWNEEFETTPNSVQDSANSLAEEYYDLAVPMLGSTAILILSLFVIDYLMFLHAQVYGLFLNAGAGIFFVFPSLKGRFVISSIVDTEDKEAIRKLEAQEMVANNAGMALLVFGFLIQVLSVQFLSRPELLQANIASRVLPNWIVGVMLLIALISGAKSLQRLRDRRLSQRGESQD